MLASRYRKLTRAELAILVPELLLCGHLIDRSGMAFVLGRLGDEGMTEVAIEEWMAASPIYTKRMQRALAFEGNDVATIFKGMQLEIGAPPQFMDFRYVVNSPTSGGFHLDHCGALLDVEPLGPGMVTHMCHHIEDPTFDATAVATNPHAVMRPVHRPPRVPSDRHPHCSWTVTIDEQNPAAQPIPALAVNERSNAANIELDAIDVSEDGSTDYSGALMSDIDFAGFAHSALVRIADEVVVQMHLLNLGFLLALGARLGEDEVRTIATQQLTGIAGLTSERVHRALGLAATVEGAAELMELHPVFNPAAYADVERVGDRITVRPSLAHQDSSWLALCGPHAPGPLQAIVRAVDPHFDVEIEGEPLSWTARVVRREEPAVQAGEVQVAKVSLGASFAFEPRRSLPLTVV